MMPKPAPVPRRLRLAVHDDASLEIASLVAGLGALFDLAQLVACVMIGIALARTELLLLLSSAVVGVLAFVLSSVAEYLAQQEQQASPWPPREASTEQDNAR